MMRVYKVHIVLVLSELHMLISYMYFHCQHCHLKINFGPPLYISSQTIYTVFIGIACMCELI